MSSLMIPFPTELRPRLPTIVGNVDYLTLCQRLEQIESLLQAGGLEQGCSKVWKHRRSSNGRPDLRGGSFSPGKRDRCCPAPCAGAGTKRGTLPARRDGGCPARWWPRDGARGSGLLRH